MARPERFERPTPWFVAFLFSVAATLLLSATASPAWILACIGVAAKEPELGVVKKEHSKPSHLRI